MKRYIPLLIAVVIVLLYLIFISINRNNNIFFDLDKEVRKNQWGENNQVKAEIFEKIYYQNKNNSNFEKLLFDYLDQDNKYYWIGIFLNSGYTNINNLDLSLKILQRGLESQKEEIYQTRYYWIIGTNLYFAGQKEEASSYLLKADELSGKYPGNKPALSQKENQEVIDYIELLNSKN